MRIWYYRLSKTKVKIHYANAREKHVSGLCGAAVETKTLVLPHMKEKQRTAIFRSVYIFLMAAVTDQKASLPLWQLLMQEFYLPG